MESRIAIINPEDFPTAHVGGKRVLPFIPSMSQILEVEEKLSAYLKANNPKLFQKWSNYFRQYMGIKIVGGVRKIRGNFLCGTDGDRWKQKWMLVKDGGDCYFNFSYDLDKQEIIEFTINGDA